MNRPVLITTPIPTLDEVVKDLGIGKSRLDSIVKIMARGKTAKRKKISPSGRPMSSSRKMAAARNPVAKNFARKTIG